MSWDASTWIRIWHFQTPVWKQHLQMHFLAEQPVFGGWWLIGVFWKRESKPMLLAPILLLNNLPIFFCFHLYNLLWRMMGGTKDVKFYTSQLPFFSVIFLQPNFWEEIKGSKEQGSLWFSIDILSIDSLYRFFLNRDSYMIHYSSFFFILNLFRFIFFIYM
jgi:hypothetical protein